MPKDRDQLTPDDPDDAEVLASGRHQGTGGTGLDELPGEEAPGSIRPDGDGTGEVSPDEIPDAEV